MINEAPLARFEPLGDKLLKPIYADYSFGNIPNTIHYLLTGERLGNLLPEDCFGGSYPRPEKVVLFFIDAFGWRSWQDHGRRFATTRRVMDEGVLTPISALFPSTTAASVSTMNLGVLPAQHALYEWNVYIPAFGEVIQTLPFSPLGQLSREVCLQKGYDPGAMLAVRETVHERLAARGVHSIQFAHRNHADSSFNRMVCAGSDVVPHVMLSEAMVQLKEALGAVKGKAWFNFYWASIDSIAHHYGPGTSYHAAEIAAFWSAFDALLSKLNSPNTLYLFTADHDQVYARRDETVYINERWPGLGESLAISPTGSTIYPNGSPRDLFLHLKPERREDVLSLLKGELAGIATVMAVDEALEIGLFGPAPVAEELRRRLGDVLVLAHDGHFVGWREPGLMENRFNGHHGGLAARELITAFGALDGL
ncbi:MULTISPECIES: alkaline phosphatase family protein [Rhodomicrobium]|uniref:alkaline phosphatase family protein n=1 Tax=Rhodomicrobium TaxID=1068 RepID=UPI000B4A8651|nr:MULTISPECIES: alkaline phosphatase family protein [Rhodomicrobium]